MEALEIYRELAASQPEVCRPDVAMTLNNLGNVLRELRELETARQVHAEALEVYRELAEWQEFAFSASLIDVLLNLGICSELQANEEYASFAYRAVLEISLAHNLWPRAAQAAAALASLARRRGNEETADALRKRCAIYLERLQQ